MGKPKVTLDQFIKEVEEKGNNEYIVIGKELINSKTPIDVKHISCGTIYGVRRDDFLRGRRCPNCSRNKPKTTEIVRNELFNTVGDEYELKSEYTKNDADLILLHKKCNKEFKTTYARFFNNKKSRCPICHNESKKIKISMDEYKQLVKDTWGDEYSIVDKRYDEVYKTLKVLTKHNNCGHEWEIDRFHLIDEMNGCTICNKIAKEESKYIKMIEDILDDMGITYIREYKLFKNPETNQFLRADFYIEGYNLVIEYDGKQHFKPMFNDKEKLKKQIKRDQIKNSLLEENKIDYIRIPYTIRKKIDIRNEIENKIKLISSEASHLCNSTEKGSGIYE